MTIVLFIVVLVALIVVHEFGHFIVAKLSGMRVDEFGIGYPPRAWGFKKGETEYTLNWLPFGGFVRIYGEDEQDRVEGTKDLARAFGSRPRLQQALVLLAGIVMNLAFAWVLLSATLFMGTLRALPAEKVATTPDAHLAITNVLPGSPAEKAGLKAGDIILGARATVTTPSGASDFTGGDPDAFTALITAPVTETSWTLSLERANGKNEDVSVTPERGIIKSDPGRPALGVSLASVAVLRTVWYKAPVEGAALTWEVTKETALGLIHFFGSIATFTADLTQVSGPIGIAGAVGNASSHGLSALLSLTAVISINLALINVLPIPALDGGRLLFVFIEAIIRRPIPASVSRTVNTVGFGLLILLMVVVSAHDIFKFFV